MNIEKLKKLIDSDADIIFEALPEDLPVKGNASAIDEKTDTETENWILEGLAQGELCRWFLAKVTIRFRKWSADNFLGACSYNSFDDFTKEKNGYYQDMILETKQDLIRAIQQDETALDYLNKEIEKL